MSRLVRALDRFALFVLLCSLAGTAVTAAPAAAERYTVGTLGATIPGENWERVQLSKDLGKDQFFRADRQYVLVALEIFDLFEVRADFVGKLDDFTSGVTAATTDLQADPEMDYLRRDGVTRATRRFKASASGMSLSYRVDLISAGDGVGYLFMSWAPASSSDGFDEQVAATLDGFELPGPDSAWAQKATPSSHRFEFGDRTVEMTFRDSVFEEKGSKPGERYTLLENGNSIVVHLFVDALDGTADSVLDQILQSVVQEKGYEELVRSDLEIPLGSGRQVLLRHDGAPSTDLAVAVVDLGDGHWIDLRMLSQGRAGHRESLWNSLLDSLQVTDASDLDAFPVVAKPKDEEPVYLDPKARRLLEESCLLGTAPSTVAAIVGDGDLLVREGQRVTRVSPAQPEDEGSASTRVLFDAGTYLRGALVPWGDRALLVGADDPLGGNDGVLMIVDGDAELAEFRADVAAPAGSAGSESSAGEDLLLARNGTSEPLVGMIGLPSVGPAEVVLRDAAGEERTLFELADQDVSALARRPSGRILVAATPRAGLSVAGEGPALRLLLTGDDGRKPKEIARWRRVDRIEPGPASWLLSGSPAEGVRGVYRLSDDGTAELLLSGPATGLALTEDELTFSTKKCLEPSEAIDPHCVYRADLALARELGRTFQPFTTETVNQIAARAWPELDGDAVNAFPSTPQEIADAVARADQATRELTGAELPSASAGVDDLLAGLYYDREVSDRGVLLLSVLLSESLLHDGAVWEPSVASARSAGATHDAGSWQTENAFAVGLHPVSVVLSTLYDEDGWYRPAENIAEQSEGRTIILGLDPKALERRVRAEEVPTLAEDLRAARVDRLAAALDARPENVYLREAVYGHLAAQGSRAELAELAGRFAARDDAHGIDLRAWLAARLAGDLSPEETATVITDLRSAIERAPDDPGLYLLLGTAYERTTDADDPTRPRELARACYRKASDTAAWGKLKDQAEAALARLGEGE